MIDRTIYAEGPGHLGGLVPYFLAPYFRARSEEAGDNNRGLRILMGDGHHGRGDSVGRPFHVMGSNRATHRVAPTDTPSFRCVGPGVNKF